MFDIRRAYKRLIKIQVGRLERYKEILEQQPTIIYNREEIYLFYNGGEEMKKFYPQVYAKLNRINILNSLYILLKFKWISRILIKYIEETSRQLKSII